MRPLAITLILLAQSWLVSAGSLDSVFVKGNNLYKEKQYHEALLCYQTILKAEKESAPLHYNLANAYFKTGETTLAILHYEKALKLDPGYQDAEYNLAIANSRITDKIETLPELFFMTWFRNARNLFSSDTWSLLTLGFFVLLLLTILGFLLLSQVLLRKISASVALLSLLLFAFCLVFSVSSHLAQTDTSAAIVTAPSVVVKSSPDDSATDLFVVHEGTRITIRETFDNWCEIQISDGNRGWITADTYAVI